MQPLCKIAEKRVFEVSRDASATWEIVTSSEPWAAKSAIAVPEMACRASCLWRSRNPVVMVSRWY